MRSGRSGRGRKPITGTWDRVTVRMAEDHIRRLERLIALGRGENFAAAIRYLIETHPDTHRSELVQ